MNVRAVSGVAAPIVLVGALVLLIGGGIIYYFVRPQPVLAPVAQERAPASSGSSAMMIDGVAPGEAGNDMVVVPSSNEDISYSGTRLAGNSAPLLAFTHADYEAAKNSGKLIVLYFYANWCPICREEFPNAEAAFNQLTTDQVVGFRVNFNDNETDAAEEALAREHGVAYQHTKVLVKSGQRIKKSPETWTQDRYVSEITAALAR